MRARRGRRSHGAEDGQAAEARHALLLPLPAAAGRGARAGPSGRLPSPASTRRSSSPGAATPTPSRRPARAAPFWNNFEVYRTMAAERNHFNVNLGDIIYSDTEVLDAAGPAGGADRADRPGQVGEVPDEPRAAEPAAAPRLRRPLQPLGRPRVRQRLHAAPRTGSRSTTPACRRSRTTTRSTTRARTGSTAASAGASNLEVFLLDERSFRSAKASANGVCNNPSTGQPDLAPTAPQGTRNLFPRSVPSLARAGVAAVPGRDQRSQPHDARPGAAGQVLQRDPAARRRASRSSSTRSRSSSSTSRPTTAGRATRPSARSWSRRSSRTSRT